MKSTEGSSGISFKDAIHILADWRQAGILLEVCFFGQRDPAETVRVLIDGLVTFVDPEGTLTISGDGREIEIDLRGCHFQRACQTEAKQEFFNPLDPASILGIQFPNGQVCMIFPYRRVSGLLLGKE